MEDLRLDHECEFNVLDQSDWPSDHYKHQGIDEYLLAKPGPLMDVVSKVMAIVDLSNSKVGLRKRKRKPEDQLSFELCMTMIVSNLAHVVLQSTKNIQIIVSRNTTSRGPSSNGGIPARTFVNCLDGMIASGLITQTIGYWSDRSSASTTVQPTATFRKMIVSHRVDFSCFRECPARPLLVLKRAAERKRWGAKTKPKAVRYARNTDTDAMVSQVAGLNAFLSEADIKFIDDPASGYILDTTNRRSLVRYFSLLQGQGTRFDQGGRLFGRCFWLALKSNLRDRIRIDGESVADLDFRNLGPRLVYAKLGQTPPEGDLYDLTGHLLGYLNDNPDHRSAIKKSFSACLNGGAGGKRGTAPTEDKPGTKGILDGLPKGITAAKIRSALASKHPAFSGLLEQCVGSQADGKVPLGFGIMFDESRILLCALEKLRALGVVALPQHDGLMVARSNQKIAQEALQAASLEIMGVVLPVSVKADYGAPEASESLLAA